VLRKGGAKDPIVRVQNFHDSSDLSRPYLDFWFNKV